MPSVDSLLLASMVSSHRPSSSLRIQSAVAAETQTAGLPRFTEELKRIEKELIDVLSGRSRVPLPALRRLVRNYGSIFALLSHSKVPIAGSADLKMLNLPRRSVDLYFSTRHERLTLVSLWMFSASSKEASKSIRHQTPPDTHVDVFKFRKWVMHMQSALPQQSPAWFVDHWRLMAKVAAYHRHRRKTLIELLVDRENMRQKLSMEPALDVCRRKDLHASEIAGVYGLIAETYGRKLYGLDQSRRILNQLPQAHRNAVASCVEPEDARWMTNSTFANLVQHISTPKPRVPELLKRRNLCSYSRPKLSKRIKTPDEDDWEMAPDEPSGDSVLQVVASRICATVEPACTNEDLRLESFIVSNPKVSFFGPLGTDNLCPVSSMVARSGSRGVGYASPLVSRQRPLYLDLDAAKCESNGELLQRYLDVSFYSKAVLKSCFA
ncbi:MAG: uncharacterized protein KVP18_004647 [Porospora cf. gigantea A]|uniref:uncharacterized protein n=1 Tax=Porospora cf. gigantea A TaxID=2853593 RepID=UPI0035599575|nr:MAG: hypothetical protein KVP18_004647 [Porospora cf. gigantea A]